MFAFMDRRNGRNRTRMALTAPAAVALLALAGCGGGARQDANEPSANFPVDVVHATWPLQQHLAQSTVLRITVRNAGQRTIPDIAVTIGSPDHPPGVSDTAAQPFAYLLNDPTEAVQSRPVWIVNSNPPANKSKPASVESNPSFDPAQENQGPAGGLVAETNTWALGALAPGRTQSFVWRLSAVQPGTHRVSYTVAAGLYGKARAVTAAGRPVTGAFTVNISSTPTGGLVDANGNPIPFLGGP
jgi:hypothetical protein